MGKDKHTFMRLSENKEAFYKELAERCKSDCISVLQKGGLQKDLYEQCWLKGFQYAGVRIARTFELSDKGVRNEKTKN